MIEPVKLTLVLAMMLIGTVAHGVQATPSSEAGIAVNENEWGEVCFFYEGQWICVDDDTLVSRP